MKKKHIFVGMRGKLYILLFCFISSHLSAQVIQKGVVVEMSSGSRPIPGVEIRSIGAAPTDSDQNGYFTMKYPSALPGDPLIKPEIYKHGFEIINNHILKTWNLTENDTLKIVLGRKDIIDALRRKYHKIGMTQMEKQYASVIESLKKEREADRLSEIEFAAKMDSITMEISQHKRLVEEYASRFARLNTDELDEDERSALELVQEGRLSEAIAIYERMNLGGKIDDNHRTLLETRQDIMVLLEPVINKFRLHQKLNEYEKCDSLAVLINKMAAKNDIPARLIYPEWLADRNREQQSLELYATIIRDCRNSDDIKTVELSFRQTFGQHVNTEAIRKVDVLISEKKEFITRKEQHL
ncbi:MAG: hypothetical protein IJ023_00530 [Bacteroidales bacterium]|nr:hypothetical protein [Bacteroidales bacterium]MBQ8854618.1 hypothetical protein [Bacteroidales bacterium]